MWIATEYGFFSAVQHRTDKDTLVVRTRCHADAKVLSDWIKDQWEKDCPVTSYEISDYPWRVFIPREVWSSFVYTCSEALDYGNFKSRVQERNPNRAHVYHDVWADLLAIEDEDPPSLRRKRWTAALFAPTAKSAKKKSKKTDKAKAEEPRSVHDLTESEWRTLQEEAPVGR